MADKTNIFEQFLNGDPSGLNFIVIGYRDPLIRYALGICPRLDVAEDAATKALALLPGKIGHFESEIHIQKFLHRTVKNKCLAVVRNINRHVAMSDAAANLPDTDAVEMRNIQESEIHSQFIITKVKLYVRGLPRKRRGDFEAHFFESKSLSQIAEERGADVDTIRENVNYALDKVRKYLKRQGYQGIF